MILKRRDFLVSTAAVSTAAVFGGQYAAAVPGNAGTTEPIAFEENKRVPTLDELVEQERAAKGVEAPYLSEIKKAKDILAACPSKQNPLQIAQYFGDLRQGVFDDIHGPNGHLYALEWPVRANPVIVSFFDATTFRKPNGDQTAWCAAFVNWCIMQARKGRDDIANLLAHTASAASETFRRWGTATNDPRPGDIVVFQHKRTAWQGHVGFFVSRNGNYIYVLGGNQMPIRARLPDGTYERRNTGEVNVKPMPLDGRDLRFHSYRTDASLHDL
jgi:uncharacterized protein (TIGR02594 family)